MIVDNDEILYDWDKTKMVEVTLAFPDDFLKIRETLTRIGIASKKDRRLYQTAHILHKRGKYYIIHFKEIFALEGKDSTLTLEDVSRRNRIVTLLADWKLCTILNEELTLNKASMSSIKVVPYKEKNQWILIEKYRLGRKPDENQNQ